MTEFSNPSDIAREALRRLAVRRIPPTPDNYLALYQEIAGAAAEDPFPDRWMKALLGALPRSNAEQLRFARQLETALAERSWGTLRRSLLGLAAEMDTPHHAWAALLRDLLQQWERRHEGLTRARKREALEHVLESCASDSEQLHMRLLGLVRGWQQAASQPAEARPQTADDGRETEQPDAEAGAACRTLLAALLEEGLGTLLADSPALASQVDQLAAEARAVRDASSASTLAEHIHELTHRMQWEVEDRAEVQRALLNLLHLVIDNIRELVADDKWLHGQIEMLLDIFAQPLNLRCLEDMEARLREVIRQQGALKKEVSEAQHRLKSLLAGFMDHLSRFGDATGTYHDAMEQSARRISEAKDIGELSELVADVVQQTRQMQESTRSSRDDLGELKQRVEFSEREIVRLQVELAHTSQMVRHDQLTGALNRKGLEEALHKEVSRCRRRGSPLCVALLDVDNFKQLNDTYGHRTGDDALVHLAQVVRGCVRPQDSFARFGGEEFLILLPETRLEDGIVILQRLQRELTRRFFLHNNNRLLLTFSAGVAELGEGETQDDAVARADKAMYRAKRAGKNRVFPAEPASNLSPAAAD